MSGYSSLYRNRPKNRSATPQRRNYDAAKSSDLFNGWGVNNTTADQLLWKSLAAIRSRSRDVIRNNSYAKKFKRMAVSNIVGPNGFRFQSKVKDSNGKPDGIANDLIEQGWAEWSRDCSINGKSLRQTLSTAVGNTLADGEVLIRKIRGVGKFGLKLQLIEADHLPEQLNDIQRGIKMGVEHDQHGKPIAYHLYRNHPGEVSSALSQELVRVPADEILHIYPPDRISQSRGVPWMHAALTGLKMLGGYEEAALVAARLGAAKGGFYTKPEGEDYPSENAQDPIQEVTPGMYEVLPEGWDFKQFDPTHPTGEFKDFSKSILRGISSGFDVSYNYLGNDLEGVNFSSIRAGVLDERDVWMSLQSWVIEDVLDDIFPDFLRMSLLTQAIRLPLAKFDKFNAAQWMGRRWQWVDPQKDMTSNILAMKAGLKAPSMIAAEMGYDIEEVYAAIARDAELREKHKITTATDAELMQMIAEIGKGDKDA